MHFIPLSIIIFRNVEQFDLLTKSQRVRSSSSLKADAPQGPEGCSLSVVIYCYFGNSIGLKPSFFNRLRVSAASALLL